MVDGTNPSLSDDVELQREQKNCFDASGGHSLIHPYDGFK